MHGSGQSCYFILILLAKRSLLPPLHSLVLVGACVRIYALCIATVYQQISEHSNTCKAGNFCGMQDLVIFSHLTVVSNLEEKLRQKVKDNNN